MATTNPIHDANFCVSSSSVCWPLGGRFAGIPSSYFQVSQVSYSLVMGRKSMALRAGFECRKLPRLMAKIAIIETGGKQYVVTQDSVLDIEKLNGHKTGDKITFDKVLLTDDGKETTVGARYVKVAKVSAELVEEGRNP